MIEERLTEALTFDDVLLCPTVRHPAVRGGRHDPPDETIALKIPIVSAAMDTVTEAHLAIASPRRGDRLHHKNMPIEAQAAEVTR